MPQREDAVGAIRCRRPSVLSSTADPGRSHTYQDGARAGVICLQRGQERIPKAEEVFVAHVCEIIGDLYNVGHSMHARLDEGTYLRSERLRGEQLRR